MAPDSIGGKVPPSHTHAQTQQTAHRHRPPSSQRAGVGGELLMGRRPRPRPHPPRPALPLPRGIGALTRTSEAVPKLVTPYYTL
eukprot:scaffold201_cov121-Isochrysis_galbana.AAC.1